MKDELPEINDPEVHRIGQEVEYAAKILKWSSEYGLEAEVVRWALDAMKSHPDISICEALTFGYDEWVK